MIGVFLSQKTIKSIVLFLSSGPRRIVYHASRKVHSDTGPVLVTSRPTLLDPSLLQEYPRWTFGVGPEVGHQGAT